MPQVDEGFIFDVDPLGAALTEAETSEVAEREAVRRQRAAQALSKAKPKSMLRAKTWTPEVENLFRFQSAGFRDANEYLVQYPEPQTWPSGFVRVLRDSKTGFFKYFREHREAEDKHLKGIKIFIY
jgi:hypothetical protein